MDDTLTSYAMNYISYVCEKFGPRISGSHEEKTAQVDLAEKLKEYSDEVALDEFKVQNAE